LDDNQLTALPKTIGKLSDLEEFILSQNDFETLPPCIGLLRKLNILNADDNMLEELPPGKFPQKFLLLALRGLYDSCFQVSGLTVNN
jgi:Leucine-rich repeat (LRR) protein